MSSSNQGAHILIFPYPAQGHMLPMLDLTHQLAIRGLTITILVTPKNLQTLDPLLSSHPSIQTLVLPFPHHSSLPSSVENVRDVGNIGNVPITIALGKLHDPILQWFKSHPTPPVALLSDYFLGWTNQLASQLGIPRITFFSSGAFFTCVLNNIWSNMETVRTLSVVIFPDLPRSPTFPIDHLTSWCRQYLQSDPDWVFFRHGFIANMSSWGWVFNAFDGLEREYLDHLRKTMGHIHVWQVGPLHLLGGERTLDRVNPESDLSEDVMKWLDGCPDGSVLYVCFGSQKLLKRDQMEALAYGLEQSNFRFIWVVKLAMDQHGGYAYEFTPDGFEDRVSARGIILKGWAPQVMILNHRAVGGFLSHCGWNSVLEGVTAGVMILAWPMEGDQFVTARLLVENMGVAICVCEGANTVPNSVKLARAIALAMSRDIPQRLRVEELRGKAMEAIRAGGSSSKDLDGLVRELAQLQVKQCE
uniref:Glycosyltransferase n=1 Tax=Actinidia deliciosa TaxID=3627 RepID=A0A077ERE3_ACTDE|nr:glycosyltransferase [Actinidia deliciosa]